MRKKLNLKLIRDLAEQRGCDSLLQLFDEPLVQTELDVYLMTPFEVLGGIRDSEIDGLGPAFSFNPATVVRADE